ATDLFVVPTIGFKLLYRLVLLVHGRRELVHRAVTAHPTAEWVARQMTEAFPWDTAPRYLVRDRDAVYGHLVRRRPRALGTRDRPTAPRSPSGRSKGTKNMTTYLDEMLKQKISVREGGKVKKMSKKEALLHSVYHKALNGDARALSSFITLARLSGLFETVT